MSAGIPGLGLGGLFFLLSALVAPLVEIVRTVRGRSTRARWASVARQFTMALAMIAAIVLALEGASALASSLGGPSSRDWGLSVGLWTPMAATVAGLTSLLLIAKFAQLAIASDRRRLRSLRRQMRGTRADPRPARR